MMPVWSFHCKQGEYKALRDSLADGGWFVSGARFSRGEWHVTAIKRSWFDSLGYEMQERVMQRLGEP